MSEAANETTPFESSELGEKLRWSLGWAGLASSVVHLAQASALMIVRAYSPRPPPLETTLVLALAALWLAYLLLFAGAITLLRRGRFALTILLLCLFLWAAGELGTEAHEAARIIGEFRREFFPDNLLYAQVLYVVSCAARALSVLLVPTLIAVAANWPELRADRHGVLIDPERPWNGSDGLPERLLKLLCTLAAAWAVFWIARVVAIGLVFEYWGISFLQGRMPRRMEIAETTERLLFAAASITAVLTAILYCRGRRTLNVLILLFAVFALGGAAAELVQLVIERRFYDESMRAWFYARILVVLPKVVFPSVLLAACRWRELLPAPSDSRAFEPILKP